MQVARDEIKLMEEYDYIVVNDQIDCACRRIMSIIEAEHCRRDTHRSAVNYQLE